MLNESEVVDSALDTVVSVLSIVTGVQVLTQVSLEKPLELEDQRLEVVFQELNTSVRFGRPGLQLSSALAAERLSKTRPRTFGDNIFTTEGVHPHSKLKTKDFNERRG